MVSRVSVTEPIWLSLMSTALAIPLSMPSCRIFGFVQKMSSPTNSMRDPSVEVRSFQQTTRFRAAVTGAGAVEHVANWGNDDTTYDDAYFLGGLPWDMMKNYNDEAAIWQMNKVKTPTHIVAGAEDIRVHVGEQYLLERAL